MSRTVSQVSGCGPITRNTRFISWRTTSVLHHNFLTHRLVPVPVTVKPQWVDHGHTSDLRSSILTVGSRWRPRKVSFTSYDSRTFPYPPFSYLNCLSLLSLWTVKSPRPTSLFSPLLNELPSNLSGCICVMTYIFGVYKSSKKSNRLQFNRK